MAGYYLLAPFAWQAGILFPGKLIDDATYDVQAIIAGGAEVWPATDQVVAAAAARVLALKSRGANFDEMTLAMQSARARSIDGKTRPFHASIVTPSTFKSPGTREPTPLEDDAAMYLSFVIGNDAAFRQYKIPAQYAGNAALHVHWTKSGTANEASKVAKWRLSYLAFPGNGGNPGATPQVVEHEGTYLDSGTTTRVIYRTPNLPLTGIVADWYLALRIEAVTPSGVAMASAPALWSADLTFDELINR